MWTNLVNRSRHISGVRPLRIDQPNLQIAHSFDLQAVGACLDWYDVYGCLLTISHNRQCQVGRLAEIVLPSHSSMCFPQRGVERRVYDLNL